ncbi:MAG TPA: hypothetical protein VFO85_04910, partial [Vicinamibacteria bacterium]|nr:hypothetical protein [Vicinamibacteria bacterium]
MHAAHLAAAAYLFGPLLAGRRLFFRDLSAHYFPDYTFLGQALRSGVWPLWNPTSDGGAPFLYAYAPDLLLALVGGAELTLGLGVLLHAWLALSGASVLARRLGCAPAGAWVAGAVFGLSGFVLSLVNLYALFEAAAWAPWVLVAGLAALRAPDARRLALLALAVALQASTLGLEIVLQTMVMGLFLAPRGTLGRRRVLAVIGGAAALALLLLAPLLLGARLLLAGTERSAGFAAAQALGFSVHPLLLVQHVWPRFLGDVHSYSDQGFWGQPFFPEGYPYVIGLY